MNFRTAQSVPEISNESPIFAGRPAPTAPGAPYYDGCRTKGFTDYVTDYDSCTYRGYCNDAATPDASSGVAHTGTTHLPFF